MIAAAVSLALLTGLWPHHHAAKPEARPTFQRAKLEGWTYEIWTDGFTGTKTCKLYGRDRKSGVRMTYVSGAVVFHLGHGLDPQTAVYRIDGGPPHASRDDEAPLAQHRVVMPNPVLNQSDQGLVFVPDQAIAGAKEVAFRPGPKARLKTVSLAGLEAALAAAEARGCRPEAFAQLEVPE